MNWLKKTVIGLLLFALIIPLNIIPMPSKAAPKVEANRYATRSVDLDKNQIIELKGERNEFSKTYLKPNGVKQKMISTEPVHFKTTENGQNVWNDIDSSLVMSESLNISGAKEYRNKANNFNLQFSEDLFNRGVKLSKDNSNLNLTLNSSNGLRSVNNSLPLIGLNNLKSSVKPALEKNNIISFKDIMKDTDLNYSSLNNGFKDEIVLKKYNKQNVFSFQLTVQNLYYREIAPGAFAFYNTETKKPVFYMPPSYMFDSLKSDEFPEGIISYNVKNEIIPNKNGYEIRLTADPKWLEDPARVYPITIDPSINVASENAGEDTFIQSGYPGTLAWNQGALFLGRTSYYSKGVTRTFVNFNNVDLTNARIYSAKASVYQYYCANACQNTGVTARMTGNYDIYGLTWNNQPWVTDSVGYMNDGGVNKWIDIDVTTAARYWYQTGNPAGTMKGSLAFTQDDESNYGQRNWKAQNTGEGLGPRLYIDYNDYSAVYNVASPGNGLVDDLFNVGAAIYNSGRNIWYTNDTYLSYHIYNSTGGLVNYDGIKTALPRNIGPGDSTSLTAQLKLPSTPGTYVIKWDLIQPGITWFSDQGIPTFDYTVTVADYPEYSAMYDPTVPAEIGANTTVTVPIKVYNGSRNSWPVDQYKISYHWLDSATGDTIIRDGLATSFSGLVPARNGQGNAYLQVKAPLNAGKYKLKIDLLQVGVTWFSDKGIATADYDVTVTPMSFSGLTRLGNEDFYSKAGPVDLATGNFSYSSTDLSVPSATGQLSLTRSYNANSLDQLYDLDSAGYIRTWLLNGPYKENDSAQRLSKSYMPETTIQPNSYATINGKPWFKATADVVLSNLPVCRPPEPSSRFSTGVSPEDILPPFQVLDINNAFDKAGTIQSGYANNSVAYSHVYVYSPTNQAVQISVGADDGFKVWLNGQMLFSNDIYFDCYINGGLLTGNLKAGWNSLLVKVSNYHNNWQLSTKLTDTNGNLISGLKYSLDNQDIFGDYQALGKGWTANFLEKLFTTDENNIYYRDGTGSVNVFNKNTDGTYKRPTAETYNLTKNIGGTYTITGKNGQKVNFDSTGRLSGAVDLSGNTVTYQYDTNGNCIKILDGTRYLTLSYSGQQLVSVSDQLGNKYQYAYDTTVSPSRLVKVTDPTGNYFSYTYLSNGKMSAFINKMGNSTSISYSPTGKASEIKDALGNSTKFTYESKKTTVTDPLNRTSLFEFDNNNLLVAFTNVKNYRERYVYDGNYNVISVYPDIPENDGYFFRYSYSYDADSNLITETDPLGSQTKYNYAGNDLVSAFDPDGSTISKIYSTDGRRLLLSEKDAKSNITSYTYDSKGNRLTVTDPENNTSKSTYSADSDLISVTSPQLETTTYTYDVIGRKLTEKSPLGKTTTYTYSNQSQLLKMTDAGGLATSYTYDKNGNLIKETNPSGGFKTYAYDTLDRLVKTTDEIGATVQYQYDAVGNKTSVTDANGKITTYRYDELNQPVTEIEPSGATTSVSYDRNGQPIKVTDANGESVQQSFDKSGNITSVTDHDGASTYTYDKDGKATGATATIGSENMTLSYDSNNNVTALSTNQNVASTVIYNKNDSPVSIQTQASSTSIAYTKDGFIQQVDTKINGQTFTTKFNRDAEGKLTNTTKPNGDTTFYSYDISNRATSVINRNVNKILLSQFNYQYDKASNITAIKDGKTGALTTYAYDARGQLTKEANKTYSYDLMGNRNAVTDSSGTTTYTYDSKDSNRLIGISYPSGQNTQFQYDANGNITKQIDSKNGTTTYQYDSDNYFTKAILPSGNIVTYWYDKLLKLRTKRVETNSSGQAISTTNFIYDGDRLVSETDGSGKILRTYSWDQSENLYAVAIPDASGTLQTFTYVKNLKNDIVGLTDKLGNPVAEYSYDAWGNITNSTTKSTSSIPNIDKLNPRLYSSYWYDSSLGLYFMKTRMYNPALGRFLSTDPLISGNVALSYNPYIYCNNSPLDKIDPSGKGFWNKVSEFGSKVVQATKNAWNYVFDQAVRGLDYLANSNIPVISSIAKGINRAADWTQGKWYRAAAIGLAVGIGAAVAMDVVAVIAGGTSAIAGAATAVAGWISTAYATVAVSVGTAAVTTYNLVATKVAATNWAGGMGNLMTHFNKHGAEVGAETPAIYTKSAQNVVQAAQLIGQNAASGRIMYIKDELITIATSNGGLITHFMFNPFIARSASTFDYLNKFLDKI